MSGSGSRRDHKRFCETEGWTVVRDAQGRPVSYHITYELTLPDGRILRTRSSRPPNSENYGHRLWAAVLSDQLEVTEAKFWACVSDKDVPDRGMISSEPPAHALPAGLVHQLIHAAGVPEDEVAAMSLERALEVMNDFWSRPKG